MRFVDIRFCWLLTVYVLESDMINYYFNDRKMRTSYCNTRILYLFAQFCIYLIGWSFKINIGLDHK